MDIAMIGLGKMGANMATRLLGKGHRVVACDVKEAAVSLRVITMALHRVPRQEAGRKAHGGTPLLPRRT